MGANPPAVTMNDDDDAQHWLAVLRDGTPAQQYEARMALARIFERKGMFEEAIELLVTNARTGDRNADLFRMLSRLYKAQGEEILSVQAAAEAARYLPSVPHDGRSAPPPIPGTPAPAGETVVRCVSCGASLEAGASPCRICGAPRPGAAHAPDASAPIGRAFRNANAHQSRLACPECAPRRHYYATQCPHGYGPASSTAPASAYQPYEVAGSGRRFLNMLLDYVGVIIFAFPIGVAVALAAPRLFDAIEDWPNLTGLALYVCYYVLFEATVQRTPAKFITRTRVVGRDGGKPGFGAILGRTLARLVPFEPFSGFWGERGTWWHDRWSGTRVVRG